MTANRADIAAMRSRAFALRWLASEIESVAVADLRCLAGPDTWLGPTADVFVGDVRILAGHLDVASTDLRVSAWRLEEDARYLEAELIKHEVASAGIR